MLLLQGRTRLSKPEKSHGFGPAAAWDGSLSLQVWSWEWGMIAVLHSSAAFLSLTSAVFSSFCPCPSPLFYHTAPALLGNDPVPRRLTCTLTSPSHSNAQSVLHNHACVQVCECAHYLNVHMWKMLRLCVSEPVCVLYIPVAGCLASWVCKVWADLHGAWSGTETCVTAWERDLGARLRSTEVWHQSKMLACC